MNFGDKEKVVRDLGVGWAVLSGHTVMGTVLLG